MYACYISYCHGQHELTNNFIEQLKKALKSYIEAYIDEEVYIDDERLKPGYRFNEELAQAICQSICMIVVYSPRYERHKYCLREYAGMKLIEDKRKALLEQYNLHGRGMIIPIIFRGDAEDLPKEIAGVSHYADFSKFTTAMPDITQNPEFVAEIEKIAQVIYECFQTFEKAPADVCAKCNEFRLPRENEVKPWRGVATRIRSPFPGRVRN